MPSLIVDRPRSRVRLRSEHLVVETPGADDAAEACGDSTGIPLAAIDRVLIREECGLSGAAIGALLRRGVPVVWLSASGRVLGGFEPPASPRGRLRLRQYERALDPAFNLAFARALVRAKISNQRRLLQRLDATRPRLGPEATQALQRVAQDLPLARDLDGLRGLEGAASAAYFSAWAQFLPEDFPFEVRSTRPPKNPVNAVLSFSSALLYGEVLSACQARGLDPAIGHFHVPTDDRQSLPLDLLEPFRPAFAEPLTLRLFSHRVLRATHFEPRQGGIYLNDAGRRLLLEHAEHRLGREFDSEHAGHRTSLRRQLQALPLLYKRALESPEEFDPFRLN